MYKIFMLVALPVLAVGWIAYWLWMRKVREKEKDQPRQVSKRLSTSRSDVTDWTQKMKEAKSPREKALKRRRELEAQRQKEQQQTESQS